MAHKHPQTIVSLAPSITTTLLEMNVSDRLIGVTTHCDYDDATTIGGWLNPDYQRIDNLDPDLILTSDALQKDIRDTLRDQGHEVSHTAPQTLQQVIDSFIHIGDAIGRREAGETVAWDFQTKLSQINRRLEDKNRPTVYCEEWSDPPMAAGNWVPDAVRIAGGEYPFVESGDRSCEIQQSTIEEQTPEHVFLHICGYGSNADPAVVSDRGWNIPAIENEKIHVVDDSLLNQPSPRLVDGVTLLARTLHPDVFFNG